MLTEARMTVVGGEAPSNWLLWIQLAAIRPVHSNGGEMLVLTRKTNQSIMIGDDVEVSVLAVSRDKIRLGITAPRDVPVFRKEVYLSIKEEEMSDNQGASKHVDKALGDLSTSDK